MRASKNGLTGQTTWRYYSVQSSLAPADEYLGLVRHQDGEEQTHATGFYYGGSWIDDNIFSLIYFGHEDDLRVTPIGTDRAGR